MTRLQDLCRSLAGHDSTSLTWIETVEEDLLGVERPIELLRDHLASLRGEALAEVIDGSRDTASHFKWLLYRHDTPRFAVWAHQYKNAADRTFGYAEVPHDHRYDIVSLIAAGGYVGETLRESADGSLSVLARDAFTAGSVMKLHHHQIHRVTELQDDTVTLVVEGHVREHSSRAHYPDGVREFPDFHARLPALVRLLTRAD